MPLDRDSNLPAARAVRYQMGTDVGDALVDVAIAVIERAPRTLAEARRASH